MRDLRKVVSALVWTFYAANAQAQLITTLAGTGWSFPALKLPAVNAPLNEIRGIALDASGNLYLSDCRNNRVMRVSTDGTLTVVAGNGIEGYSGDGGPATAASLYCPYGVAIDGAANLYIADFGNVRVRKLTPNGIITTVAGNGGFIWPGDGGLATNAGFFGPEGIAVDSAGNVYISDNGYVRKVTLDGTITTAADLGVHGPFGPNTGLAIDAAGNLYIAGAGTGGVSRLTPGGVLTVLVAPSALSGPAAVAVDTLENLYVSETGKQDIVKITPSGIVTVVAGNGISGFAGDNGPALAASLNGPFGVAVDSAGNLYIADDGNNRVRKVTAAGIISTIAGNGLFRFSGDGGPAQSAVLGYEAPTVVTTDRSGNVYMVDAGRIRKITPAGIITTVAGNGTVGFSGDGGPAINAQFSGGPGYFAIFGLSVDAAGNLYITDTGNGRIRKVTPDGMITTVAGNGSTTHSGDGGPATRAGLFQPQDAIVDPVGNLIIAESGGLRKVTPAGIITTLNTSISARNIAMDLQGNIYTVEGSTIRKLTPAGILTTVAGMASSTGFGGYSGDGGPATSAQLNGPYAVAVDTAGNFYIADTGNDRIRKVTPGGIIATIAGNGSSGHSGDGGPATSAALFVPEGVAVDAAGNVYIADTFNSRLRIVLAKQPALGVAPAQLSFTGQSGGAPTPAQSFGITSVAGLGFSLTVTTATGGNWLSATPQSGAAPRLIDVVADPSNLSSPGTYQGTITIATPNANPAISTVNVTFTVSAAQSPGLAPLDPRNFSFAFAKSTPAQSQRLTISNAGGGTLSFTAATSIATPAGAKWLTLSQISGQASPGSPAILTVTADAVGLGPGTFTGAIRVTAGATTLSVPVTVTVSVLDQAILLSQRGLFFTAVAQGGVVPPQTFAVRNIGAGVVAWTAKPVPPSPINGVVSATPAWFNVSPSSGSTDAAQSPPTVSVTVDQSKLVEGTTYYGLVQVDAPTAANSPQVVTVVLQVLKAGSNVGAVLTPGSLLFSTSAGASSPSSQNVLVYNITANAKSFRSVVSADPGLSLVTLPTDATLDPQNPTPIVVQPFTAALGPGVYTGVVTLQFDDGRVIRLTVKVIVAMPGGASSASIRSSGIRAGDAAAAGCTPTKLQPILTAPNEAFEGFTGFGMKLGVFVKDDCGVPLQSGSVEVRFNNGDTKSTLQPLQGGLWEGTWYTHNPSTNVNLNVHAENMGISGDLQTNGSLASQTPPAFDEAGIFSGFGGAASAPLAPGEVISIYGSGLAETSLAASGFPLNTTLVDTLVTIQGTPLPLYYVGEKQVNAVVPYSLSNTSLNAPLQILVQRGNTLSQPVYVTVATAEPTIYGGVNAVTSYPASGGSPYIVTPANPAHAGDTIVIYCLGLGAVDPPVADGGLPTGTSKAAPVQTLIGNQAATVTFQGLTPQFPGLYQVNAVVPAGVPKGSAPVTISLGGQTSLPIQIPIQ